MKPGDTIFIPRFGDYKAFKARLGMIPKTGTCTREGDRYYCDGAKLASLCEELPCNGFSEPLVFFKVDHA
jgi:hypothetical protein